MQSKHIVIICVVIIATVAIAGVLWYYNSYTNKAITSFEDCARAGYPIMESYPPRCNADGRTFTQDIGNEVDKSDSIRISSPRPNATVSRTLIVEGEARGPWFFEASFPIHLKDSSGKNIVTIVAQAEGEWMTTEFVPFQATLDIPYTFSGPAVLVLEKNNPSGLPEHDDSLRVPITVR